MPSPPSIPSVGELPLPEAAQPMWRRLLDLVLADPLPNLLVGIAIVIGFFHGWMKLIWRMPITTFAFDIPLVLALILILPRVRSLSDFFPPGRSGRMMLVYYGVVLAAFLLSFVLPGAAPPVVSLAAARAWVFPTLMFGLGYQIVSSRRQLHGYFILVILLAAITSYYATLQTEGEVRALQALDPYYELRTRGQGFVDDTGRWVLRRFSTFISSGAFGGTMAVSLLFAASLLTDRTIGAFERLILMGLSGLICWGMFLSGARSALVGFLFGFLVLIWYRRLSLGMLLVCIVLAAGYYLGMRTTSGGTASRFSDFGIEGIVGRLWVVVSPGMDYLVKSGFIGGGLGRSPGGLPLFLFSLMGSYDVRAVDGDLGRLAVDMGLPGLVVVAMLLIAALRDGFRVLIRQRGSLVGTLTLGAVSCFWVSVITFPTGSPFIGIPMGVLSWFFLGAALRLDKVESGEVATDTVEAAPSPEVARNASPIKLDAPPKPRRTFMYELRPAAKKREKGRKKLAPAAPAGHSASTQVGTPDRSQSRSKRFLYR